MFTMLKSSQLLCPLNLIAGIREAFQKPNNNYTSNLSSSNVKEPASLGVWLKVETLVALY